MNNELLTRRQAAELLDVKPQTLAAWASQRRGPAFVKIGKNVRYTRAALQRYLAQRTVETDEVR